MSFAKQNLVNSINRNGKPEPKSKQSNQQPNQSLLSTVAESETLKTNQSTEPPTEPPTKGSGLSCRSVRPDSCCD